MDREALQKAIEACRIRDVYIRESTLQMDKDFDPTVPGQQLNLQFRVQAEEFFLKSLPGTTDHEVNLFRVHIRAGLRFLLAEKTTGSEAQVAAELTALFVSDYRITAQPPPEDSALAEFAKHNAVFNIWPYWREFLQSMCLRHRLPNVILPMFTLPGQGKTVNSEPTT
jgi:hypothetical protein